MKYFLLGIFFMAGLLSLPMIGQAQYDDLHTVHGEIDFNHVLREFSNYKLFSQSFP